MRNVHLGGGLVVGLLLLPVMTDAQPPTPPPPNIAAPQTAPNPNMATQAAPITLTGCLVRSKPARVHEGTGATAPATDPPTAYVLRTDEPGASGTPTVYNVISLDQSVQFEQHVGHRVQLTGTIRPATNQQPGMSNQGVSPSTPSGSTGMETMPKPDPMAAPTAAGPASVIQPVMVQSLKRVEGGC